MGCNPLYQLSLTCTYCSTTCRYYCYTSVCYKNTLKLFFRQDQFILSTTYNIDKAILFPTNVALNNNNYNNCLLFHDNATSIERATIFVSCHFKSVVIIDCLQSFLSNSFVPLSLLEAIVNHILEKQYLKQCQTTSPDSY